MTNSSDGGDHGPDGEEPEAFEAFKRNHGMEDWTVRFTADELRARETAEKYREVGFEVRVLPLSPVGEEIEPESFGAFEDLDHDPLQYVQDESCAGCLDGTHVVLTKRATESSEDRTDDLVYEDG